MCVSSQSHLLEIALFGALLGLVPAAMAGIALGRLEVADSDERSLLGHVLLSLAILIVATAGVLIFLWWGPFANDFFAGVVLGLALVLFLVGLPEEKRDKPPAYL